MVSSCEKSGSERAALLKCVLFFTVVVAAELKVAELDGAGRGIEEGVALLRAFLRLLGRFLGLRLNLRRLREVGGA